MRRRTIHKMLSVSSGAVNQTFFLQPCVVLTAQLFIRMATSNGAGNNASDDYAVAELTYGGVPFVFESQNDNENLLAAAFTFPWNFLEPGNGVIKPVGLEQDGTVPFGISLYAIVGAGSPVVAVYSNFILDLAVS